MPDHVSLDSVRRRAGAQPALHDFIALQFRDLVRNPLFPCTIARGSVAQDRIAVSVYEDLGDPASNEFSFSLGGRAFFLVGMHPGASRHARRFAYPAIMFNMHLQFEALRARGSYDSVRDRIRGNDVKLQGSINPSLHDHGAASEARQYSGRDVEADWVCPFRSEPANFAAGAA